MKTRPTPETDAHKRHMDHVSFLSELTKTYSLARKLEQERDEAREAAALVPELVTTLEAMADYYVQLVNTGDAGQWNPEEDDVVIKSRAAIAKAKGGQPLPNPLDEAVQRMEAVPWKDIAEVWFTLEDEKGRSRRQEVIEAIRTRLIQAVKGGQP